MKKYTYVAECEAERITDIRDNDIITIAENGCPRIMGATKEWMLAWKPEVGDWLVRTSSNTYITETDYNFRTNFTEVKE